MRACVPHKPLAIVLLATPVLLLRYIADDDDHDDTRFSRTRALDDAAMLF